MDKNEEVNKETITTFLREAKLVTLDPSEIKNAFGIGPARSSMLVTFSSEDTRARVFANKRNLKDKEIAKKVYINDSLTKYRSDIFKLARDNVKEKKLHAAWTIKGTIKIKEQKDSKPRIINSKDELYQIIN